MFNSHFFTWAGLQPFPWLNVTILFLDWELQYVMTIGYALCAAPLGIFTSEVWPHLPVGLQLMTFILFSSNAYVPLASLFPKSVGIIGMKAILYPTILPIFVDIVGPCRMLLYTLRGELLGSFCVLQPTHTLIYFLCHAHFL